MSWSKLVEVVIPGLLGLIGVGVGTFYAQRRWRRDRAATDSTRYRDELSSAYRTLWDKVEEIHIGLREGLLRGDRLGGRIQELNAFMLKGGLFLGQRDQDLAKDYVSSLTRLIEIVDASGDVTAQEAILTTGAISPKVLAHAQDIADAVDATDRVRNDLILRVRSVLGAETIDEEA